MQSHISNSESRVFHPSCQNQRYQWYPWSSILLSDLHVRVVSFFAGQRVTSESYQRLHSREDSFSRRGNLSVLHKGHQWWWRHSGARTVCLLSVLIDVLFSSLSTTYIYIQFFNCSKVSCGCAWCWEGFSSHRGGLKTENGRLANEHQLQSPRCRV